MPGDVECPPAAGDPLGRGAGGPDGLDLGVPGGMLGRLGGGYAPFGRFDLRNHLLGLLADGALQRRKLGGLLGVPPAGLEFGLGAGALLVGGPFQPATGARDAAALPRLLAAAAGAASTPPIWARTCCGR